MGTVPGIAKETTNHWLHNSRIGGAAVLAATTGASTALAVLDARHALPVGLAVYIEIQAWLIVIAALAGVALVVGWLLTVARTGDIGEAIAGTAAEVCRHAAEHSHWEGLLERHGVGHADALGDGEGARGSGG